jgi:uncharacterized membrane protein
MLTPSGYIHALALGTILWSTLGYKGWTVCVLYLLLGQLVTKIGFQTKTKLGIAEGRGGRRGPENVWGSAAAGTICTLAAASSSSSPSIFLGLSNEVWILGYIASTVAAFIATMIESVIGATLQGKKGMSWMTNEVVNFINTVIGAIVAMSLGVLLLGM